MPQNYGRRESENQSAEWGFGDRQPYPYDNGGNSKSQPGVHGEGWGWGDQQSGYAQQGPGQSSHSGGPSQQQQQQQQQQHGQYGQGCSAQPWNSSGGVGDGRDGRHGSYQRQHSSQHGRYSYHHEQQQQSQPQHHDHHGHGQLHRRHSVSQQPPPPHPSYGSQQPQQQQRPMSPTMWSTAQQENAVARDRERESGSRREDPRDDQGSPAEGSGSSQRRGSIGDSGGDETWGTYNDCFRECGRHLAPHLEMFNMLNRTTDAETAGGPARANYKKQNNFLMKVIFDKRGECMYHVDCVLRAFKISKGRLKRLQERIKRELRGELTRHGLFGRPSNNRKKPETLRQFTDFVKANRIEANDEDGGAKVRYMLPSKITSIQGDAPGSLKTQFDRHQLEMSTNEAPRELVSSGTAQSWFKKYFSDDTMPPSANHAPEGSITASAAAASVSVGTGQEDDDQESTSSDARDSGGTAQPVSSLSMSTTSSNSNAEKRPSASSQSSEPPARKRSRIDHNNDQNNGESDENDSTDGTASTGNGSSDVQSRSERSERSDATSSRDSRDGSKGTAGGSSGASDSGFGSIEGNASSRGVHHQHHPPHHKHPHPHPVHVPAKKHGSDSDGSMVVESPELD